MCSFFLSILLFISPVRSLVKCHFLVFSSVIGTGFIGSFTISVCVGSAMVPVGTTGVEAVGVVLVNAPVRYPPNAPVKVFNSGGISCLFHARDIMALTHIIKASAIVKVTTLITLRLSSGCPFMRDHSWF